MFFMNRINDLFSVTDYIDRTSSNIVKGICICLIVLGHNYVLTDTISGLFNYLYSFHVFIFFILPCFYKYKHITFTKILNRSLKLLIWYFLFFVLLVIVYHFLYEVKFSWYGTVISFFKGGHNALDSVTGYQYLWFLPAFIVTMLIYDLYNTINRNYKVLFIIFALVLYIFFIHVAYTNFGAIIQGIYFASVGILTIGFHNLVKGKASIGILFSAFIIATIFFRVPNVSKFIVPIMPFLSFVLFWEIAKTMNSKLKLFEYLGKNSLFIYLIHPLVYQVLVRVMPEFKPMLLYGLIILLFTLIISFLFSNVISRILNYFQH